MARSKPRRAPAPPTMSGYPVTTTPCPLCVELLTQGRIRRETVMPVPVGAMAPRSRYRGCAICVDCAAAEGLMPQVGTFEMARIATGNCRQESLRLPGLAMGLVMAGYMRASQEGDFDRHHAWLDRVLPSEPDED